MDVAGVYFLSACDMVCNWNEYNFSLRLGAVVDGVVGGCGCQCVRQLLTMWSVATVASAFGSRRRCGRQLQLTVRLAVVDIAVGSCSGWCGLISSLVSGIGVRCCT